MAIVRYPYAATNSSLLRGQSVGSSVPEVVILQVLSRFLHFVLRNPPGRQVNYQTSTKISDPATACDGHLTPTRSYLRSAPISNGKERNAREERLWYKNSGFSAGTLNPNHQAQASPALNLKTHPPSQIALKYQLLQRTSFRESFP
ncbi:hypothetical protein AGABI1DRAFT_128392 [Agaricus bisporus var. burnettii JB137-S8]|uniref:Uncharacterized protein n=1 Tax=Agaricus bisporus var. burnettii (strain JB137-S8 / ATCC MYA-4627 / FGSC 10392) TaxID=597362 RepID=K5WUV1_AGABU|nr:uncharacterized protein AGABI1DRAFT_128392 [Agaricus bisporus var. burnettii JB137-S8]EKM79231.1 hypothetical protein AGABI1DRAFT_128392 [Agaricus bisporus var. burnettii JB137-S8]